MAIGLGKGKTGSAKPTGAKAGAAASMEGAEKIDPSTVKERELPKVKSQSDFDKYLEAHLSDIGATGSPPYVVDIKVVADRMKKHGVSDSQFLTMFSNSVADTNKFSARKASDSGVTAPDFKLNGLTRNVIAFDSPSAFKANKEIDLWHQSTKGKKSGEVIDSSANFQKAAMQYINSRATRDAGLVPIHSIRSAVGDRTTRAEFNGWMLNLQGSGKVQLTSGDLPGVTRAQLDASVSIPGGGVRFYAVPQ